MTRLPCETCGWVGVHLPDDPEASEIDLIGFMASDDSDEGKSASWICQCCYDAYQAINPDAIPVTFQFERGPE